MPKFERKTEIDAPVEKVWEAIINPNYWPKWFPGIESVSKVTAIKEGGTFEWTKEGKTGKGIIQKMVPMKSLEILTQMDNDKDKLEFKLKASGGFLGLSADECTVDYEMDTLTGGGILGAFVAGGNPIDALKVKKTLHTLRKLVESL